MIMDPRIRQPYHTVHLDETDVGEDVCGGVGQPLEELVLEPLQLHLVAIRGLQKKQPHAHRKPQKLRQQQQQTRIDRVSFRPERERKTKRPDNCASEAAPPRLLSV